MSLKQVRSLALLVLAFTTGACGDTGSAQTEQDVRAIVDEVIPEVERAVGLSFTEVPQLAVRTREQVRTYLDAKIATELPPEEVERLTIAYRLFGLIPDTLDLGALLLELYTEQVAGYYDPDSATLYVVDGTDPAIARLTIAHELVHALQDQYVPLDSILSSKGQNDRRLAAQAVLEGQATLGSMLALFPNQDADELGEFWNDAERRRAMEEQAQMMPVFAAAPRIIRDGLVFPYLAGADFVRWFSRHYPDTVPFGPRLPASTEHILRPERYRVGDAPVDLTFEEAQQALYADGLGQFELQVLLSELTASESVASAGAFGWAGDRYAVFEVESGHALVWWTVWDDERSAERFESILADAWTGRTADGWRHVIERVDVGRIPGVLFVYGPVDWERWEDPPRVSAR